MPFSRGKKVDPACEETDDETCSVPIVEQSRPSWFVPEHPPLNNAETATAVKENVTTYPKVTRSQKDFAVSQQSYGLISSLFFKEPKMLANGKKYYGFMKLRGNWDGVDQCKSKASDIVRTQDSKNTILIAPIGSWVPITDDVTFILENVDVNTDVPEDKLKEEARKEQEKEQDRIMREVRERATEIKNAPDYNENDDGIDYYTMKRVSLLRLTENIDLYQRKASELIEKKYQQREILRKIDGKHPEYATAWIDNYNKERRASGIPDYRISQKEASDYETS